MTRALASALLALCCLLSWADPWDSDSIALVFSQRQLDPVEGVWQMPGDGARLLISRSSASTFQIVLLDSPRLDIAPGIVIGRASATASPGKYDAHLSPKALADKHVSSANAILSISAGGILKIEPYRTGKKLNLKRWLPYLLRVVENGDTRPAGIDGAVREYPIDPDNYKPCL